jgi:deazaflavin-dependent oxidoreductase (nitroreductase family)
MRVLGGNGKESRLATAKDTNTLKERLTRYRQIKLSVIGRKSGKTISNPVWFVAEGDTLYLLPVHGSDTQWFKNVLKNPAIRIDARGSEAELRAQPMNKSDSVKSVIEKFREKYGATDVKKYYSKFDVAVEAPLQA